jgi:hypothetical protein
MEAAMIVTWANPVRGREGPALETFMKAQAYWEQQIEAGRCQSREVFLASNGHGMSIVRGDSETLRQLTESDEYLELNNHIVLNVDGYESGIWSAGGEIDRVVGAYAKAISSL